MSDIAYFKERFDQLQSGNTALAGFREEAFGDFRAMGIPTTRHEDWKYTRISSLFNKTFQLGENPGLSAADIAAFRLPGAEAANELVFINGVYSEALSTLRSPELTLLPLETAATDERYKELVAQHYNHSKDYLKDGINALNTALAAGGIFLFVQRGKTVSHPVYVYNITDGRTAPVLAQPRSLVYIAAAAQVDITETYCSIGDSDSLTNQVMEVIVEEDALFYYYKIQNDRSNASQVSTTHIRQIGRSFVHAVTVSLDGAIVRNNLHVVLEAPHSEAHLYGLYFQQGNTHIDNHTIVDNAVPDCQSNELYKGILDGNSTGVFNGKVFVRPQAQKTNAFQSNKNILLSETATVNTKPQLEIFADDVKCSHGCTVGSLDEEAMFYLRSRGITKQQAMALLLQGFATDIVEKIKPEAIRQYVLQLLAQRLTIELS